RSMSAGPALWTVATSDPSNGERTSNVDPVSTRPPRSRIPNSPSRLAVVVPISRSYARSTAGAALAWGTRGRGTAMPITTRDVPRTQHNRDKRDREPVRFAADEPRNSDLRSQQISTPRPHAGFDADLNPIDDDDINTHGSER